MGGAGRSSGIMEELEAGNVANVCRKLVLMKLWLADPSNQPLRWSSLVPPDETEPHRDGERADNEQRDGENSGSSTPIISGARAPDLTTGQTGQTGQTMQNVEQDMGMSDDPSPETSPHSTMKIEGKEEDKGGEPEVDPVAEYEGGCPGSAQLKHDVYKFMDDPESYPAHMFSAFIMCVIVYSVLTMVVESLPKYTYNDDGTRDRDSEKVFFVMETVCIIIFSIEYVIRFYCVPRKCWFVFQPMNVVDFSAIAPYYITLVLQSVVDVSQLNILRLLRIIRVFRVLKLAKYNRSLTVAIDALKDSTDMFGLMVFMLVVLCILFASFEYNFEMDQTESPTPFESIPAAMWWCIVTVMMVGYGDMWPSTVIGKFIASGCIVVGILIMALPISVIGSNFSRTWEKYEAKVREERKKLEASRVFTREEEIEIEARKMGEVVKINTKCEELLREFRGSCEQQVDKIQTKEREVFDVGARIWQNFAVDVKKLNSRDTGAKIELWREREVRSTVSEGRAFMGTLTEDNITLSKVLDQELSEQLQRARSNAKWMRMLLIKYQMASKDVLGIAGHFGVSHEGLEIPQAVQDSLAAMATTAAATTNSSPAAQERPLSRARTPSPPREFSTCMARQS